MILFHACKLSHFRGDFVVPANYWHQHLPKLVHFAESRDKAMQWIRNPLARWSLWAIDSDDVPGLEPNPRYLGHWQTAKPVPVSAFMHVQTFNPELGEIQRVVDYVEALL